MKNKILSALDRRESFITNQLGIHCVEYGNIYKEIVKIFKIEAAGLLNEFWQSSSDACPLEESTMNSQLREFEAFINAKYGTN